MKLELKHLAPYLPYGLKVTKKDWAKIFKMDNDGTTLNCVGIDYILKVNAKPILRQLSDLTKEIEVNGEKFVPIEKLTKMFDLHKNYELRFENNLFVLWDKKNCWYSINDNNFSLFQKLFEWHFDVFGLIEKGLAIDINTLN